MQIRSVVCVQELHSSCKTMILTPHYEVKFKASLRILPLRVAAVFPIVYISATNSHL